MNTFEETAIVDNTSQFADQGKQTSIFSFRLLQTKGSWSFPFSVCNKQTEVAVFRQFCFVCICKWKTEIYIFICSRFKRKMEAQAISLICLSFAHRANRSLLFGHFLIKKQTKLSIGKGTKQTCPSMKIKILICFW